MYAEIVSDVLEKIENDHQIQNGSNREDRAIFFLAQQIKGRPMVVQENAANMFLDNIHSVYADFNMTERDFRVELRQRMRQVKYAPGEKLLRVAEEVAEEDVSADWPEYDDDIMLLLKVCRDLQGLKKEFYLSGKDAGRILGKKPSTGSSWLLQLCEDGILKLNKKGAYKRASYYTLLIGTRVQSTESRAQSTDYKSPRAQRDDLKSSFCTNETTSK